MEHVFREVSKNGSSVEVSMDRFMTPSVKIDGRPMFIFSLGYEYRTKTDEAFSGYNMLSIKGYYPGTLTMVTIKLDLITGVLTSDEREA